MKKLILIRHGDTEAGLADPPLSATGRAELEKLSHLLASEAKGITTLYYSPKKRTEECARILSAQMPSLTSLEAPITPNAPLQPFLDDLAGGPSALVVSHLPFLTRLLSQLLLGTEEHDLFLFGSGSAIALQESAPYYQILWAVNN